MLNYRAQLSSAALEVQSYVVRFKTVASLKIVQVFDMKEEKNSDEGLPKPSTLAPQSKRHCKVISVVVHLDRSFA